VKIRLEKIKSKFFLLILFFFFVFSPKIAFAEWEKCSGNPIFEGTPGGWDSFHTACSFVIYENSIYKMWYEGHNGTLGWRIGYASSENGRSNWQKSSQSIIDIVTSPVWEMDVGHPSVIHDSNFYKIWYSSMSSRWYSGEDRFRIRYGTSLNETDWTEDNWVLYGTPGAWDSGGQSRGIFVIKTSEGSYHLWYTGMDSFWNLRIGYATSPDGINWTKQNGGQPVIIPTEPWELSNVSYPNIIYEDGLYQMWYGAGVGDMPTQIVYATSTDGVHWDKPADKNPVFGLGSGGSWDDVGLASPFVLKQGNNYKMWYSGFDGSRWRIGYAENITSPSPLQSLVLLPGLGASWNHQKMLMGLDQPQSAWFMTPGIKVYDGLIETFKNAGYHIEGEEKNLFVFNYDWTKPVNDIVEDFKNYLQNEVSPSLGEEIDLVGHSLGGLVARTYVQNNPDNQVEQLLTLGSPHHGAVQTYYPWEGGDISTFPIWERIGLGLLLYLRNPGYPTPKDTIHLVAPVIQNLLPDINYLKRNTVEIPLGTMSEKNTWLVNLNTSPPEYLFTKLTPLAGQIPNSTLRWINVGKRNWLDSILGLWPDGKPTDQTQSAEGDRTVLSESASLSGVTPINLPNLNHRQLVSSAEGQQKIMDTLGLNPAIISDISEPFDYEPTLVFMIASPASINILDQNNNPVGFGDGKLMIVPNAPEGQYQISLTGSANGNYSLYFGQLTAVKDIWATLAGVINEGQAIIHQVNFQPQNPLPNPWIDDDGNEYLQSVQTKILRIREEINKGSFSFAVKQSLLSKLNEVSEYLNKKLYEKAIISLYQFRMIITSLQVNKTLDSNSAGILRNSLQEIINDLEQVYIIKENNKGSTYSAKALKKEILMAESVFLQLQYRLKFGKHIPDAGQLYLLAQDKINQAKSSSSYKAHINALGAQNLSQEGFLL
jgi:pimeloyl-ACP methyl ester carboxylesterase